MRTRRGRERQSPDPEVEAYYREQEMERLMRAPEGGPAPFERAGPRGSPQRPPGQRNRGGWRPTDAD